ncbi:acyl-CoA synthetase [Methylobacterium sp. Leaf104]|uniref:AMP-binding protein n=1 Tax=Methylobacterium TaxID=407 RepID=UPI000701BA57|nr:MULTISPECIES: AMP-binding protein [Methylobacterium]KQP30018.1 acyl-CoA synthetase [Methylobacterium sp. Leaf104]MCI9881442.1 acyl--CoA ligase [Methylobacterium goesingense]
MTGASGTGPGRPALVGPGSGPASPPGEGPDSARVPPRAQRLCTLLAGTAHAHPDRVAFVDPPHKSLWSGRPAITWTYGAAAEIVARLANGLRSWRLAPGSRIGLALPGSAESFLAYLAVEAAGHIPCLLPLTLDEEGLLAAVQQAALPAVITQTRFGPLALAERLCRVAVRYFGLRYLAAFGPEVPDGVISLDAMALDQAGGPFAAGPGGVISFAEGDPARPVHRGGDALLAAIAVYLVTARVEPGDRILSLVPQSDLRGLVTGLGAALVAGAGLETLPVFEARSFAAALDRPLPTRLVVPAALERNLSVSRLPATLHGVVLAHRAPGRLGPRSLAPAPHRPVVDVIAFDETALLAGAREANDVALSLTHPERGHLFSTLMALRRDPDGHLAFRGRACHAEALQRDIAIPETVDAWAASPFAAGIEDDRTLAIRRA